MIKLDFSNTGIPVTEVLKYGDKVTKICDEFQKNKNDEQLNIALDINKEEIKFIDTKIKTFIYEKAKSMYLYDEVEVNKCASM